MVLGSSPAQFFGAAGAAAAAGGYTIDRSLRFNSADSAYLNRTPASAGNRKTWTWAGWVKRSRLDGSNFDTFFAFYQDPNNFTNIGTYRDREDDIGIIDKSGGVTNLRVTTNALFRDLSAWLHVVCAVDTTAATSSDRAKIYINGVLQTSLYSANYGSGNTDTWFNSTNEHYIGFNGSYYSNGYLADVHFIDGQALDPTSFGEFDTNGVWQPKAYTFGTNPNNGTTWSNSVSGTALSGYGTPNAFDGNTSTTCYPDRPGTLTFTPASTLTGKVGLWFNANTGGSDTASISINGTDVSATLRAYQTSQGTTPNYYEFDNFTGLSSLVWEAVSGTDGWGIQAITVGGYTLINGAGDNSFHLPFSDNSSAAALGNDTSGNNNDWTVNNFVANASFTGFKAVTYTGNGTSQSITGVGFSPDLVWVKQRNSDRDHCLCDVVRGTSKRLRSNTTDAETTESVVTAFDSNGFTIGSDNGVNQSSGTYVAWCWDAGSSTVSNTDGSITSSVRANQATGFSVVSYTGNNTAGATVGHGLGAAPGLLIVKSRNQTGQYWHVWHSSLADNQYIYLNTTGAVTSGSDFLNSTRPGSSTFTLGSGNACNKSADPVIAYCFAPKAGVSAFGSYTGNGSSTGPVVTTGFKPAFVMIKSTQSEDRWTIQDSARSPSNPSTVSLAPNLSNAELTSAFDLDFTSNGFQIKNTNSGHNTNGGTYIYMAFASAADAKDIDSLVDSVTNGDTANDTGLGGEVPGNYCTLNPLVNPAGSTFSNGNLDCVTAASTAGRVVGSIAVSSGKWYWEVVKTGGSAGQLVGIAPASEFTVDEPGKTSNSFAYYTDGQKYNNATLSSYGSSWTTNDVIGVALNLDSGTLVFYKNGVSQGTAFSSLSGTFVAAVSDDTSTSTNFSINFGQRPFAYPVSGFKALCTTNLPEPTIADGSTVMDVVLWTGNNTDDRVITTNFSPEFLWVKRRDSSSSHRLTDVVRGNGKILYSELTDAEATETTTIKSLGSTGFTLGTSVGVNATSGTYVGWYWDAGSSTVTNTSGSISSQVRANASAGFSIVTYTGNGTSPSTIGHGLGVAPKLIITKNRDAAYNWITYSSEIGSSQVLALDTTLAAFTPSGGNYGSVTSSTYQVVQGSNFTNLNRSGDNYVAYCFAPVAGYSAFGSFNIASSSDNFIYTGFRPRFLLYKYSNTTGNWAIFDTARNTYNVADYYLFANSSGAEGTSANWDFLSNGFKLRNSLPVGNTVIWAAFAEHPFQTARAR